MAFVSDNFLQSIDNVRFEPVIDDALIGPHILMAWGDVELKIQLSNTELFNTEQWVYKVRSRNKRRQQKSRR